MNHTRRLTFLVCIAHVLTLGSLSAQERFPLGPLGAVGEVVADRADILVIQVLEGPARKAGLQTQDCIVGLSKTPFAKHTSRLMDGGRGPQKTLGEALDEHRGGEFALRVLRGEQRLTLRCELPERSSFARSGYGAESPAAHELRDAAARQLVRAQKKDGHWNAPVGLTADRVVTAWALLALRAHGDPAHADACTRAATWLRGPGGRAWLPEEVTKKGPDNLGNWALTFTAFALAEEELRHQATSKEASTHVPVLRLICSALSKRMTKEGRFGHDVTVGYGGKGFNLINTLAHLAWASSARAGIPLHEDSWKRSFREIKTSIDPNGGIRYWTMKGTGTSDASLRTSSMALALFLTEREPGLANRFSQYLVKHAPRAREAHAVGSLGMMTTALALGALDEAGLETFLEEWRFYLCLMRGPQDEIRYIGGKGNNGGDSYLGKDFMACIIALLMLGSHEKNLHLLRPVKDASRKRTGR